jgi:hypothetical protein
MSASTSRRSEVATARRNARLDSATNRIFAQNLAITDRKHVAVMKKFLALRWSLHRAVTCWGIESETDIQSKDATRGLDALAIIAKQFLSAKTDARGRVLPRVRSPRAV